MAEFDYKMRISARGALRNSIASTPKRLILEDEELYFSYISASFFTHENVNDERKICTAKSIICLDYNENNVMIISCVDEVSGSRSTE